jgi:hypothetical protein
MDSMKFLEKKIDLFFWLKTFFLLRDIEECILLTH